MTNELSCILTNTNKTDTKRMCNTYIPFGISWSECEIFEMWGEPHRTTYEYKREVMEKNGMVHEHTHSQRSHRTAVSRAISFTWGTRYAARGIRHTQYRRVKTNNNIRILYYLYSLHIAFCGLWWAHICHRWLALLYSFAIGWENSMSVRYVCSGIEIGWVLMAHRRQGTKKKNRQKKRMRKRYNWSHRWACLMCVCLPGTHVVPSFIHYSIFFLFFALHLCLLNISSSSSRASSIYNFEQINFN